MNQFLNFDYHRNNKSFLILFCSIFLFHVHVYAQDNILQRRISVELKQIPLSDALLKIGEAADVTFHTAIPKSIVAS